MSWLKKNIKYLGYVLNPLGLLVNPPKTNKSLRRDFERNLADFQKTHGRDPEVNEPFGFTTGGTLFTGVDIGLGSVHNDVNNPMRGQTGFTPFSNVMMLQPIEKSDDMFSVLPPTVDLTVSDQPAIDLAADIKAAEDKVTKDVTLVDGTTAKITTDPITATLATNAAGAVDSSKTSERIAFIGLAVALAGLILKR